MGDERRVMISAEGAVFLQEVEQMRHLLKIRGYIRIVATQMDVVELKVDDPLDLVACRLKMTGRLNGRGSRLCRGGSDRKGCSCQKHRRGQLASGTQPVRRWSTK